MRIVRELSCRWSHRFAHVFGALLAVVIGIPFLAFGQLPPTDDELLLKLKAFEKEVRDAQPDQDLLGVELSSDGTTLRLVCRPKSSLCQSLRSTAIKKTAPSSDSKYPHKVERVEIVEQEPYLAQGNVEGGAKGWGNGLNGYGTIGWSIVLDNVPVAVSNWHVLCPQGNTTPFGTAVMAQTTTTSEEEVASVLHCEPIRDFAADNLWDFAIAKYKSSDIPVEQMRACEDLSRRPYPGKLGFSTDLSGGDVFWTVGARPAICSKGKWQAIGSVSVQYGDGSIRRFTEQLIFDKMTDPGDSGSLVVNERSGKVVGLVFAGDQKRTIANPFYRMGWTYEGTRVLGGHELPVYRSNNKNISSGFNVALLKGLPSLETAVLPPPLKRVGAVLSATTLSATTVNGGQFKVLQPFNSEWIQVITVPNFTPRNPYDVPPPGVTGWLHLPSATIYSGD